MIERDAKKRKTWQVGPYRFAPVGVMHPVIRMRQGRLQLRLRTILRKTRMRRGERDQVLEALNASEEELALRITALEETEQALQERDMELAASLEQLRQANESLEEKRERVQDLSYFDALTGLPNDVLLEETASDYVSMLAPLWLFRIRLARMDRIRDMMGHHIGDELLRMMSARLKKQTQGVLMLARSDRDAFSILATPDQVPSPEVFLDAVLKALSHSCTIGSWTHRPGAHVGYAQFPDDAVAWSLLEKKVGMALVSAAEGGTGKHLRWQPYMEEKVQEKLLMELNLQKALQNGEIQPAYQAIVNAETGRVRGFEALMRWNSPVHGQVAPAKFIPILEESGMIVTYGEWMLRTCCSRNLRWQEMTGMKTIISINVSTVQIRHGRFPETVSRVLEETGMPPETLEIEVTESVLLEDMENGLRDLHAIRALGCRISMDDFGTGYSSLSYLRTLPIHTLKIDKSFVDDIALFAGILQEPRMPAPPSSQSDVADAEGMTRGRDTQLQAVAEGMPRERDTQPQAVAEGMQRGRDTQPQAGAEDRHASMKSPVRLIGSIVSLAHDLDLDVVAEGVESEAQRKHLNASHCDLLQGYMFRKPIDAAAVTAMLEKGTILPESTDP